MSMSSRSSAGDSRRGSRTRRTSTHSSPARKSNLKTSSQRATQSGPSSSSIHGGLPEELWTSPTIGNRSRSASQKVPRAEKHRGNSNSFSTTFSARSGDITYTGSTSAEGAVFTYTKTAAADRYSSSAARPPREPHRSVSAVRPGTSQAASYYTSDQQPSKESEFTQERLKSMSDSDIDNIVSKVTEMFSGAGPARTSLQSGESSRQYNEESKGYEHTRDSDRHATSAKHKVEFAPGSFKEHYSSTANVGRNRRTEPSGMEASRLYTYKDISPESSVTDSQSELSAEPNDHGSSDERENFSHGLPARSQRTRPDTRQVRSGGSTSKRPLNTKRKSGKKKPKQDVTPVTDAYAPSGVDTDRDPNEQMYRLMKLHSTEVKNLKSKHKSEVNRIKKYYKEKLRSLQERQKEVDEMNASYFARMQTKYEQQIQRLKKLLENETERLNQARAALVQTAQIQTGEDHDTGETEEWTTAKSRATPSVSAEHLIQELTKKVTSLQRAVKRKDSELSQMQRKLADNHKRVKSLSEENQQLKQPSLRERQYQHELSEMKEQLANLRRIVYGKSF
eukprot:gb/GECG01007784.1/.p1 GENE.gb/GECG01007784.1/~~gb/GECG01007784.1/.p1  ORF type:complete len:564 (+),score=83.99 gb/GECG01007784.1/:1-1692(+)